MKHPITQTATRPEALPGILTALLTQPAGALEVIGATTALVPSPATQRRVARLEREAPHVVADAKKVGVDIEPLGIHPLFNETRVYAGVDTDWTVQPLRDANDAVVPKRERALIERLHESGVIDMPALYICHETSKERTKDLVALHDGPVAVDRSMAADLVGPIPEPREALDLAERLGQRAEQVMHVAARTAVNTARVAGAAAVGVAALPVMVLGGLAAATVDPIILGAVPAGASSVGEPAFFYVVARWDW